MKRFLLITALICLAVHAGAQFKPSNITLGGGLGMQFGDYTVVSFSPQIGYNFNRYLNAGAGVNYSYYSEKYGGNQWKQTNNYFGFNLYARVYPLSFLVLQIQPEVYRAWETVEYRPTGEKSKTDKIVPAFLVGGGIRLGSVMAMIQYDIAQNSRSPYGDRLIYSVGYTFSF